MTALGGALRLWNLGHPHHLVFDETYYVKEAGSYLRFGYEMAPRQDLTTTGGADGAWNHGTTDIFGTAPEFVVHPPGGKWMIAAGEWALGADNPWGWRISAAVAGTLAILLMARIGRRLLGSTLLGATAALLLAVDGQHFVHSRLGMLDIFVSLWALAAFGCLLLDRDRDRNSTRTGGGVRWWRLAAALCLGACTSVKWSGLYFAAAFGLMSVLWDVAARRRRGERHWLALGLLRDGPVAAATMLPIVAGVYVASWTGWLRGSGGYQRHWATDHPATGLDRFVPDALRSLAAYHQQMWNSSVNLHAFHAYRSNPWSWLVQARPTSYDYKDLTRGQEGCHLDKCTQAILALGNPVIWWAGTVALGVVLVVWLLGRDGRAGAILAGIAGGYLPWFAYQERTIYTFYTVAFAPYVVLALTFCLGLLIGPAPPPGRRHPRPVRLTAAGGIVVLAVGTFGFFHPVYTDRLGTHLDWENRMWLPTWWWPEPDPAASTSATPSATPSVTPPATPSVTPSRSRSPGTSRLP